jgi:hypothetical protein
VPSEPVSGTASDRQRGAHRLARSDRHGNAHANKYRLPVTTRARISASNVAAGENVREHAAS